MPEIVTIQSAIGGSGGGDFDGKSAAEAVPAPKRLALAALASARANTVWRNGDFNSDTPSESLTFFLTVVRFSE